MHPLDRPDDATESTRTVSAQLAEQPAYRFRFGIGTLLVVTTVFSLVFAVAWYLGGAGTSMVILGVAGCVLLGQMVGLLVVSVKPEARFPQIARTEQWLVITLAATAITIVPMLFLSGGKMYVDYVETGSMEEELGFTYSTRYVSVGPGSRQMVIDTVAPGGVFDLAGVQPGEYIVTEDSPNEVLRKLARARGKQITLRFAKQHGVTVAGQPPDSRTVVISVPKAGTPSAPVAPPPGEVEEEFGGDGIESPNEGS